MIDDYGFGGYSIKVIGVVGACNNIVNRLYNIGIDEAGIIAINTDWQHLDVIKADKKVQVVFSGSIRSPKVPTLKTVSPSHPLSGRHDAL